jgi:hypothetical protein
LLALFTGCSKPISISFVVKPQWWRVLQLCAVDLPHTHTSVVREIYDQSDRLKKQILISLRDRPISFIIDGLTYIRR